LIGGNGGTEAAARASVAVLVGKKREDMMQKQREGRELGLDLK
jgi:hypothetical protein